MLFETSNSDRITHTRGKAEEEEEEEEEKGWKRGDPWAISSHCIARRNWKGNTMYLTFTVPVYYITTPRIVYLFFLLVMPGPNISKILEYSSRLDNNLLTHPA